MQKIFSYLPKLGPVPWLSPNLSVSQKIFNQKLGHNVFHHQKCFYSTDPKKLRVMFFGTDSFAVESLSKIYEEYKSEPGCVSRLEVTCLEMKSLVPAVNKFAKKNNLNIHVWPPDLEHIKKNFDLGFLWIEGYSNRLFVTKFFNGSNGAGNYSVMLNNNAFFMTVLIYDDNHCDSSSGRAKAKQ